jgi:hypothetical protein
VRRSPIPVMDFSRATEEQTILRHGVINPRPREDQYTWPGLIIVLLGIPVYFLWSRAGPVAGVRPSI